jgi:formylglycine-generating enzyme required for sulfatase activity
MKPSNKLIVIPFIVIICANIASEGFAEENTPKDDIPPKPELVKIEGGTFKMGTPLKKNEQDYYPDEAPVDMKVESFLIGKHLVTASEFCKYLNSKEAKEEKDYKREELCRITDCHKTIGAWSSSITIVNGDYAPRPGMEKTPVNCAAWHGAIGYCRWLSKLHNRNYRLPTEIEWEFMARGTEERLWPWGNTPPCEKKGLRWDKAKRNQPVAVGSYPDGATPCGVMDVMGYDGEWCMNPYVDSLEVLKKMIRSEWDDDPQEKDNAMELGQHTFGGATFTVTYDDETEEYVFSPFVINNVIVGPDTPIRIKKIKYKVYKNRVARGCSYRDYNAQGIIARFKSGPRPWHEFIFNCIFMDGSADTVGRVWTRHEMKINMIWLGFRLACDLDQATKEQQNKKPEVISPQVPNGADQSNSPTTGERVISPPRTKNENPQVPQEGEAKK